MSNVDWNNKDNNWTINEEKEKKKKFNYKYLVYVLLGLLTTILILLLSWLIIKANKKEYSINSDQLQLIVGEKYSVKEKGTYEYKVEDESVINVLKNGTIKCLKEGATYLTVFDGEKDKVILINVVSKNKKDDKVEVIEDEIKDKTEEEKNIEVKNIEISKKELSINKGDKYKLTVTIEPVNATSHELKWESDNANVVVDSEGVILGNKVGSSTITVTTSNGKTATCTVQVMETNIVVSSISLNVSQKEMNIGESFELKESINPNNAKTNISWNSSDSSIVTVKNGKITALKSGTATITVSTSNGKTATCRVTVKSVSPTSITLNTTNITLKVNESFQLTPTINPNGANKTVTWISSNNSVATVVNGKVTGIKNGTATIIANTSNGKTATCEVKVGSGTNDGKISYLLKKYTCKVGEKIDTKIEVSGATSPSAISKYSSANTSVATVESGWTSGLNTSCTNCRAVHITCKSAGTTEIKATSSSGKTTTSTVTVTK